VVSRSRQPTSRVALQSRRPSLPPPPCRPAPSIAEFPPDRWCSIYQSVVPVHFWHLNETSNSRKGGFKRSLTTKRLSSTRSSTVSSTSSRISGALRNGIQGKTPAMIFKSYGRWCQKHCSRFVCYYQPLLPTLSTNFERVS
jgi:hypothetical protein